MFGRSIELHSRRGGSFDYPRHVFWMRKYETFILLRTLISKPELISTAFRALFYFGQYRQE